MFVFLCCSKVSASADISPLITLLLRHLKKVFICIWFSASFLYNAVHAVTWISRNDISHIKGCQTPAFLQGFIIRFYYESPSLGDTEPNDSCFVSWQIFFLRFSTSNPPPPKNKSKRSDVAMLAWTKAHDVPSIVHLEGKWRTKTRKTSPPASRALSQQRTRSHTLVAHNLSFAISCANYPWKVSTVGDWVFL